MTQMTTWNPLTMFTERKEPGELSMTRVIAWIFAVTYCGVFIRNAANAHAIGWPFCLLGIAILLAVPLQALFKTFTRWASTPPGKKALETLLSRVASSAHGALPTTTTTEVTTSTTSVPPDDNAAKG